MTAPILEIQVDTEVRLPSASMPPKVLELIRRWLRGRGAGKQAGRSGGLPHVLEVRGPQVLLPQALLPIVTQACHRHGTVFHIEDQRLTLPVPAFHPRLHLTDEEQDGARRLLLQDAVTLLADRDEQQRLAIDHIARRQQRTLVITDGERSVQRWLELLGSELSLGEPQLGPLDHLSEQTLVTVGQYRGLYRRPPELLRRQFGLLCFDSLDTVEATLALRTIRSSGSRYLLGLGGTAPRPDGMQDMLILTLGGTVHRMQPPATSPASLPLQLRGEATRFSFAYSGRSQYPALISALARDPERARQVAADIEAEARAGQPCVVLSERRDHLELLASLLPPDLPHTLLTSDVKPARRGPLVEQFERGECLVLLSIRSLALELHKGHRFSRLFLTFPFTYMQGLEPAVARLVQPFDAQTDAVLWDYNDPEVSPLQRSFDQRQTFFQRLRRDARKDALRKAQLDLPLSAAPLSPSLPTTAQGSSRRKTSGVDPRPVQLTLAGLDPQNGTSRK